MLLKIDSQNPLREGLTAERVPAPCALVIFGASGDLTFRKLLPALFGLFQKHLLPAAFTIIGLSRSPLSTEEFRAKLRLVLQEQIPHLSENLWESFSTTIEYVAGDYADPTAYRELAAKLTASARDRGTHNRILYLATPPGVFAEIVFNLGFAGLQREDAGFSRLVVEKPFGHDLDSARELNRKIREVFREEQIFRIDHYLGKETVQNILVMRFGNSIFEPIWNRRYVDHVQITAAEELGIGGRAGYYERSGVVRDMFQNHLFQVMCLVAMEPPISMEAETIRDEKLKVLRAIQPFDNKTVLSRAVRGQYGPGLLAGTRIPGYREEPGVATDSITPTYAAMKIFLNNWRWQGIPFLLRSGKRLVKRTTEVAVFFRDPPHLLFRENAINLLPNILVVRIQPDEGMTLRLEAKVPGMSMETRTVNMDFSYGSSFVHGLPDAYERLLLDCMLGDATLFTRGDETELSWQTLAPVLEVWDHTQPSEPFPNYEAGTWGPAAAARLFGDGRHQWRRL